MSDTAELLEELATLDEVTATIPTVKDHTRGTVPNWCELLLAIRRFNDGSLKPAYPLDVTLPLRRHDGELIIQVLWDVLHPELPTSTTEQLWERLDAVVVKIQRRVDKGKEPLRADVGYALGLAESIAVMTNPIDPDVDAVRAMAMDRYEARHGSVGVSA